MVALGEQDKLTVYKRAVAVAGVLDRIAQAIPDRRPDLRDQLYRASGSVPLNIAEGAGEFSPADKMRFYRIARRSASECQSALDVLAQIHIDHPERAAARSELSEIGAMLTAMIAAVEKRK
ncbi:MAG: four helix bundle protein [Methanobacteriota archaeon]